MGFDPTPEQQAVIEAFYAGDHLTVEAGAGAGKTSTLKLLSAAVPDRADGTKRTGLYMAYNNSIAKEAAQEFPKNTLCKTGHGHFWKFTTDTQKARLNWPRQKGFDTANILGIDSPVQVGEGARLPARRIAALAMETVTRFCRSADLEIAAEHVPRQKGVDDPTARAFLANHVLPYAKRAWDDVMAENGRLKWDHDYYRKAFHLSGRLLAGDFLFLDEAQDSNGVVIDIVRRHQQAGMRIVAVGDENQSINGWMGATNAMDAFGGTRLTLTKSFRFGPAIADAANQWLHLLDSNLRIEGHEPVRSIIGPMPGVPDAILTRTNAKAVAEAMTLLAKGHKVALVKQVGAQIASLARAAQQLKETGQTDHGELCAFTSWQQVQEYVDQDAGGSDLRVFVQLVDEHGADVILKAMESLAEDKYAEVTISTAHRSKGLEWERVRIADDFEPKRDDEGRLPYPSREDMMLAYVAVTRAKKHLDLGGLSWVNELVSPATTGALDVRSLRLPTLDPWANDNARNADRFMQNMMREMRAGRR